MTTHGSNIRIPITIGVIVIVLMVTFASISQTYASLLSLVANGAQDVYLTDAPKIKDFAFKYQRRE